MSYIGFAVTCLVVVSLFLFVGYKLCTQVRVNSDGQMSIGIGNLQISSNGGGIASFCFAFLLSLYAINYVRPPTSQPVEELLQQLSVADNDIALVDALSIIKKDAERGESDVDPTLTRKIAAMIRIGAIDVLNLLAAQESSASVPERSTSDNLESEVGESVEQVLSIPDLVEDEQPSELYASVDATELSIDGEAVEGVFDENNMEHWYRFQVITAGDYLIHTSPGSTPIEHTDTVIELYRSSDGQKVGADDDSGPGTYSILLEDLDPDTYDLYVYSYGGEAGSYAVSVGSDLELIESQFDEFVFSRDEALQLEIDEPYLGQFIDGSESIWFELTVPMDGEYIIQTTSVADTNSIAIDTDTVLELYSNEPMTLIGQDDDGNEDDLRYSRLVENLSAATTYYIRVLSFWNLSGDFQISVTSAE